MAGQNPSSRRRQLLRLGGLRRSPATAALTWNDSTEDKDPPVEPTSAEPMSCASRGRHSIEYARARICSRWQVLKSPRGPPLMRHPVACEAHPPIERRTNNSQSRHDVQVEAESCLARCSKGG